MLLPASSQISELVARRYSMKKVFLKFLQNSSKNTCNLGQNICRLFRVLAPFTFTSSEKELRLLSLESEYMSCYTTQDS